MAHARGTTLLQAGPINARSMPPQCTAPRYKDRQPQRQVNSLIRFMEMRCRTDVIRFQAAARQNWESHTLVTL
jgi:hypothetical protein